MATINYPNIDPVLLRDELHVAHAIEPSAQIGEIGPQRVSKGTRRACIEVHLPAVPAPERVDADRNSAVQCDKEGPRAQGRTALLQTAARLEASDQALASEHAGPGALFLAMAVQTSPLASYPRVCRHVVHPFLLVLGPTCCMSHSATDCKEEEEDKGVVELVMLDEPMAIDSLTNGAVSVKNAHAWVDEFVCSMRRPGAQRTEDSVLRL
ncbi:hypothetical protein OBBRIDRAFT_808596 [Obba rivulosa]|uniref:Uncharacterized protein n=1 Tax=Obba rivulosa TaxID=1052685 RepID=A0A8E2AIC0_9APHY|nr:hypothetical protein OBBRIDRAFT_808596 [Obba rivulosa]